MALSTKNIPQGGTPKTLSPGNHRCKLNNIELLDGYNPESLHVVFHVEGEPVGAGFEGFLRDKDDQSKGRFEGQVGRVKASQWAFESKTLPSGAEINRDESILKILMAIAKAQGKTAELDTVEADNIQDYIEKAKAVLCNDTFIYWCFGGREYEKNNYTNFDLYLPKAQGNSYAFSDDREHVIDFEKAKHIIKAKGATKTDEFAPPATGNDFDLG